MAIGSSAIMPTRPANPAIATIPLMKFTNEIFSPDLLKPNPNAARQTIRNRNAPKSDDCRAVTKAPGG